jgi:hypothetical protein
MLAEWVRLHEGVDVVEHAGTVSLVHPWGAVALGSVDPVIVRAVRELVDTPVPVSTVDRLVSGPDPVRLARWYLVVDAIAGLLEHELRFGATRLARSVPLAAGAVHREVPWPVGTTARLSRFTLVRRTEAGLAAESPLSYRRVMLDSPVSRKVAAVLSMPVTPEELAAAMPAVDPVIAEVVTEFLAGCGLLRYLPGSRRDQPASDAWYRTAAAAFGPDQGTAEVRKPANRLARSHAGCYQRTVRSPWSAQGWPVCCRPARH